MKKLFIIFGLIIDLLICINILDRSLSMISSPDTFSVLIGVCGLMIIIVLVFISIKIVKKFWKK